MSLFSQETFLKEVRTLVPTQEKIKTLALYMKTLSSYSTKMVQILDAEFRSSNSYHKLNILYLANELILNIKKTDLELALLREQMSSFVMVHFDLARKEMEEHPTLQTKLKDLQKIWYERKLFTPEMLGDKSTSSKPTVSFVNVPIENLSVKTKDSEFTYSKEEIHAKIDEYFEAKNSLAKYLEGMMKRLKKNNL